MSYIPDYKPTAKEIDIIADLNRYSTIGAFFRPLTNRAVSISKNLPLDASLISTKHLPEDTDINTREKKSRVSIITKKHKLAEVLKDIYNSKSNRSYCET